VESESFHSQKSASPIIIISITSIRSGGEVKKEITAYECPTDFGVSEKSLRVLQQAGPALLQRPDCQSDQEQLHTELVVEPM
jgi:hypothetical protein